TRCTERTTRRGWAIPMALRTPMEPGTRSGTAGPGGTGRSGLAAERTVPGRAPDVRRPAGPRRTRGVTGRGVMGRRADRAAGRTVAGLAFVETRCGNRITDIPNEHGCQAVFTGLPGGFGRVAHPVV